MTMNNAGFHLMPNNVTVYMLYYGLYDEQKPLPLLLRSKIPVDYSFHYFHGDQIKIVRFKYRMA